MVFLAILAVARMVIWITRLKLVREGISVPDRDLIVYFKHLLKVKIRCDWRRLPRVEFDKRWVHNTSLCIRRGAKFQCVFPP